MSPVTQRRVARALRAGGPEVIEVGTEDVAPLKAGEALVRMEAAGLNHAETLIRSGTYTVPRNSAGPVSRLARCLALSQVIEPSGAGPGHVSVDRVWTDAALSRRGLRLCRDGHARHGPRCSSICKRFNRPFGLGSQL